MSIRTASVLALTLGLLAAPALADPLPAAGRYRCILIGMGGCSEDACTGSGVRRGAEIVLRLDFDRNQARLNGLRGTILRDGDGGAGPPVIAWRLNLLGLETIQFERLQRLLVVRLRHDDSEAEFSCRRSA